jgi:hypothetical protein
MAYQYGFWGCFAVFAVTALFRFTVARRIRKEMVLQGGSSTGEESRGKLNFIQLLRQHKARFPESRTRFFCNVLIGVQLAAAAASVALIVAAQFQTHSMYHLIHAAR